MAEPIIKLGNNVEIDENSNGELVLRHTPSGATFEYDSSAGAWVPSDPLGTSSTPVSGTSHFNALNTDVLNTDWVVDAGDYNTIQAAVDDAKSQSIQLVVIPPGSYTFSSTLNIPDGIVVDSLGWFGNDPRVLFFGESGVDPVVAPKSQTGFGVRVHGVGVFPDSSENCWTGDLRRGIISGCNLGGDVSITSNGNGNSSGGALINNRVGGDISADTGVDASFLIDQNRSTGTITSNNATEGTNT